MIHLLNEDRFDFIPNHDKGFVLGFNDEMSRLAYDIWWQNREWVLLGKVYDYLSEIGEQI